MSLQHEEEKKKKLPSLKQMMREKRSSVPVLPDIGSDDLRKWKKSDKYSSSTIQLSQHMMTPITKRNSPRGELKKTLDAIEMLKNKGKVEPKSGEEFALGQSYKKKVFKVGSIVAAQLSERNPQMLPSVSRIVMSNGFPSLPDYQDRRTSSQNDLLNQRTIEMYTNNAYGFKDHKKNVRNY